MAANTKNYNLRKDAPEDYYDVGVVNDNLDKIDYALKNIYTEAKNKDGGNADTVDGKHADELQNYNNLTNKPASLPANGGNADTVDNKHASDFVQYNNRYFNDCNDVHTPGIYNMSNECYHRPDTNCEYKLIVLETSSNNYTNGKFIVQIAFERFTGTNTYSGNSKIWIRSYHAAMGYWTYWKEISTEGHTHNKSDITDLPSSFPADGGNADTVDNKHAFDFLGATDYIYPYKNGAETENLNDIKTEYHGFVFNCINAPVGYGYGFLDVSKFDGSGFSPASDGVIRQMFTNWNTGELFIRVFENNTWHDWIRSGDNSNADTVDGKHASDLQDYNNLTNKPTSLKNPNSLTLQLNGTSQGAYDGSASKTVNITPSGIGALPYSVVSNGDFNEMKTPGIYTMRSASSNKPDSGSYYGLIVLKSDNGDYIEQIAFKESSYLIYIRYYNSNGWSEWKKINDGGNADTVDGKRASDFIQQHGIKTSCNVNSITEPGEYYIQGGSNLPDNEHKYGYLKNYKGYSSDYILQTYTQCQNTDNPILHIRKKESGNWGNWNSVMGCVHKTVSFNASSGNWYRFADTGGGASRECGGIFILSSGNSTTVFAAAQEWTTSKGENKISKIVHSFFNERVTKLRMVNEYAGLNQYIEAYIGGTSENLDITFDIIFIGKGWHLMDNVETANILSNYVLHEIEL